MKVLVVGGYGFIGSSIAEKLIQEKAKVTIIDDLSTGNKENVSLKHNSFVIDANSHRCQKVFKDENFDVVIYALSQRLNHDLNIHLERKSSNIVSLRHMLELSYVHKVKKFIFLSSYEVYGDHEMNLSETTELLPRTDYGSDYFYQESFCRDYMNKGLEVNILRLSKVYGPKLVFEENNIIALSGYHEKSNQYIKMERHQHISKDYVYINDVADAVLKTIENQAPSVLNISSNQSYMNSQIIDMCNALTGGEGQMEYYDIANDNEVYSFRLDNSLAYRTIGWHPITEIKVGLHRTRRWYDRFKAEEEEEEDAFLDEVDKSFWSKLYPYLETLAIFIGFIGVKWLFYSFFKIDVDVMIVYIIMISVFYGLAQGTLSVVLSSLFFLGLQWADGADVAHIIFDLSNIFHVSIYVLIGIFAGYSLDREKYNIRLVTRDYDDMKQELDFVVGVYEKSIKIKNSLQYDIENYEDSFGKVFDITDRLNHVNNDAIYNASVDVVSDIMKASHVSLVYLDKSGYYGRVMAVKGDHRYPNSLKVETSDFLSYAVTEKRIYINRNLDKEKPMLAAPIIFNDQVISVVLIDDIAFENISLHYVNMLKVVTLLISNAIGSAALYQDAIEAEKYYQGTMIMRDKWFNEMIAIKEKASEHDLSTSYILSLNLSVEQGIESFDELNKLVRNFDYIGSRDGERVQVLFSNARVEDHPILIERFRSQGFEIEEA